MLGLISEWTMEMDGTVTPFNSEAKAIFNLGMNKVLFLSVRCNKPDSF